MGTDTPNEDRVIQDHLDNGIQRLSDLERTGTELVRAIHDCMDKQMVTAHDGEQQRALLRLIQAIGNVKLIVMKA